MLILESERADIPETHASSLHILHATYYLHLHLLRAISSSLAMLASWAFGAYFNEGLDAGHTAAPICR